MKVLFFDIDGTLFDSSIGHIKPRTIEAIHLAQSKNNLCFICSGRPYSFIADNVKEIGFDGYILANGANIQYKNKSISVKYLPYHHIKQIIDLAEKKHLEYILLSQSHAYLKDHFHYLHQFYQSCNVNADQFRSEYDLDEVLHRIIKVELHFINDQILKEFDELFKDFFVLPQDNSKVAEISLPDISKGSAILNVLTALNIPLEESYCFGDALNDMTMFETVGHPIAMGNAIDDIKEKAEKIIDTCINDGVAKELEKMFKNRV